MIGDLCQVCGGTGEVQVTGPQISASCPHCRHGLQQSSPVRTQADLNHAMETAVRAIEEAFGRKKR